MSALELVTHEGYGHSVSSGPGDHHRTQPSDDTVLVKVPLFCADSFYILLSCDPGGCHHRSDWSGFDSSICALFRSQLRAGDVMVFCVFFFLRLLN